MKSSCIAPSLLLSTTGATTPGPNDNHNWMVGQDHERSNDASEEPGRMCLPFSCEQGWRAHHCGTGIARTNVLMYSLKACLVDGPSTAKLRGLP